MNFFKRKLNSISRYIIWHYFSKKLQAIHVVEYPKSGGTWLTQLVSNYTELPTRRDQLPKFEKAVFHGHYLFSKKFNNTICIVRDGRDIIVSYYHHIIIGNNKANKKRILKLRKKIGIVNYEDVRGNLPKFINYLNNEYAKGFNKFSWTTLINSYLNQPSVCFVKYEDMLKDTQSELVKVLTFLNYPIDYNKVIETVNKFSFENQTKRKPGEEDKKSFLRKGTSGDWKNYFTKESAELFIKYSGNELIMLGYEENHDWVNNLE